MEIELQPLHRFARGQIMECRLLKGIRENVWGEMRCFVSCFDLFLVMLFVWKCKTSLRKLINCGICQSGTLFYKFEKYSQDLCFV